MDIRELRRLVAHLEEERARRLERQREIGRLILPSRGIFPGEQRDTLRESSLFNPVARRALRKAAAGMTQAITPASDPWFRHAFLRREDRELTGANQYVDTVDSRLRATLAAGGFYRAIHAFNTELLAFGSALLSCEAAPQTIARFDCQTCGSYAVALDADRQLSCVVRRLRMTPGELAERFGEDRMTSQARALGETRPYSTVEVVHVVRRRPQRDTGSSDARNMPWASFWYEEQGSTLLRESGFASMPFCFASWEEGRGVYGTGPGDEALADQKGIEAWERRKAVGIEKMIDPPLLAPGQLKRHVPIAPGQVISDTSFGQANALRPLYEVNFGTAVSAVQTEVNQITQRLEELMYANLFAEMSLETRPAGMTMTEYLDRRRRSAELMGPVVSSYETRVLTPVLERTFLLLEQAGHLPPPPDGLSPDALLCESYQSPMAQMLEQSGAVAVSRFLEQVEPLARVQPELLDKIDSDQLVDELAQRLGVPATVIRSDEQVAALRQQRAQQRAQQLLQQELQGEMDTLAKVGGMRTQGTVAGALLGSPEDA